MKTETQIAQENIEGCGEIESLGSATCKKNQICDECWLKSVVHKATCQRFLEFLEDIQLYDVQNKITDLKQAIKLYNEAGIQ